MDTGEGRNAADTLPRAMEPHVIPTYAWKGWDLPLYHLYEKKSLAIYKRYLAGLHQ